MKNLCLLLFLVSTCLSSGYSQNLVPNPSFEDLGGTDPSHWSFDFQWTNDLVGWNKLGSHGGSADYYHANNYWGAYDDDDQTARTGDAYIGMVSSFTFIIPEYREYVQIKLTSPLVAGQAYEVSAWVSLKESSNYSSDGFGFHLTTTPIIGSGSSNADALALTPTVDNPSNNFMIDKSNWQQITGTFYASGGEEYLTIGNFNNDANTNYNNVGGGSSSTAYVFVDDVSVVTTTILPVEILSFNTECNENSVHLDWSTASEINNDYFTIERSTDAVNYEVVGTINGNGNSSTQISYSWTDDNPLSGTTYYRLKQTDFNGAFEYHGIKPVSCEQDDNVSVHPNPFENSFTVQLPEKTTYPITVEVVNRFGRKVHIQRLETNVTVIDLNNLPADIYYVKVFNETIYLVERMVKIK